MQTPYMVAFLSVETSNKHQEPVAYGNIVTANRMLREPLIENSKIMNRDVQLITRFE